MTARVAIVGGGTAGHVYPAWPWPARSGSADMT